MGCLAAILGVILLSIVIYLWYLILKNVGYEPSNEKYCEVFGCAFPDQYNINWFGEIWWWSLLWLPILIGLIIHLKKSITKEKLLRVKKVVSFQGKRVMFGSLAGVIVLGAVFAIIHQNNKIKGLNEYSDYLVEDFFDPILPDFSSVDSDYRNKTLIAFFRGPFYDIPEKEQYVVLDNLRETYLSVLKEQGYGQRLKAEDIIVISKFTTFGVIATLEKNLLINPSTNKDFDGSKLAGNESLPTDSLERIVQVKQSKYSDSSCEHSTRDNTSARIHCVKMIIIEKCGQYMGSHMKNGQLQNWGEQPYAEILKSCVREHISPDNIPFPYNE